MNSQLTSGGAVWPLLLVDDEEDLRELLAILLADLGFSVISASDGEEALALFREKRPSIVLTDIKMPGLDGIGLLKAVKDIDPETEVIMLSGHGDLELAILSLKFQAADFITKPIDDPLLVHALKKAQERICLRRQLKDYTENLERLAAEKSARVVELERALAARQIVEGLSQSLRFIAGQVDEPGLFADIPCYVSVHGPDQRLLTASDLYRQRFGTPEYGFSIYKDAGPGGQGTPVAETLRSGRGCRRQETLVGLDGRDFPAVISATPVAGQDNRVALVLEVAVDVSALVRLKGELRAARQRYHDLFEAVPSYITVQDRDLRIVEANSLFRREFGQEGGRCHELYRHREEPCPDCPVLATFETGQRHELETVVTARDGRNVNIWVRTEPLLDEHGSVARVMEVATDITPIRELQDHLSSLGIMLGSMSHGVKGLLMGLDGGIYRVDTGITRIDWERVKSGWDTVRVRLERIRKMVLDILYYAKSRELETSRLELRDFAEDLAAIVETKAQAAGIELRREFEGANGGFEADPTALSSALVNFLENAVDACLAHTNGTPRVLRFAARAEPGAVVFEIEDNGCGMDRETREKMFTLFFSSKGSKGTGIGLFVSNQIVGRHHGRIEVDSEPGRGSRFTVILPAAQPGAS